MRVECGGVAAQKGGFGRLSRANSFREMEAGTNGTRKIRRHSFSSSKTMTTALGSGENPPASSPDDSSNHSIFKKFQKKRGRNGSMVSLVTTAAPRNLTGGGGKVHGDNKKAADNSEKRGKSWISALKFKKRKKNKLVDSPKSRYQQHASSKDGPEIPTRPDGESVRVIVTELCPQAYYKIMPITCYTTAFEIIVKIIQEYGIGEEEEPSSFYLTEVKESDLGSYSRVLENSDQLYKIQSRWDRDMDCCFALCRSQEETTAKNVSSDSEIQLEDAVPSKTTLRAMIVSPSQDSFYGYAGLSEMDDTLYLPPLDSHETTPDILQPPGNFQGVSSGVQSSMLVEGHSEGEPLETEEKASLIQTKTKIKPGKQGSRFMSFSDSNIETIAEQEIEDEASRDPDSGTGIKENGNGIEEKDRVSRRQLMQMSISGGMQGIMSKVVSETKRHSPNIRNPRSRCQTAPPTLIRSRDGNTISPPPQPREDISVRKLLCSPYPPVELKKHSNVPNFKFSPVTSRSSTSKDDETDVGSSLFGSLALEENQEGGVTLLHQEGVRVWSSDLVTSSYSMKTEEEEEERENDLFVVIKEINPFESRRLVEKTPRNLETRLVIAPHKNYSTRIKFTPTKYTSHMDLLKPLSSILDTKLNSSREQLLLLTSSSSTNDIHLDTAQSSARFTPRFKRCLTDSPPVKTSVTKLKRPHSFQVKFLRSYATSSTSTDFTSDEIIRNAALKRMVRKQKPKGQMVTGAGAGAGASKSPQQPGEVVTDLDALVRQQQAHKTKTVSSRETPSGRVHHPSWVRRSHSIDSGRGKPEVVTREFNESESAKKGKSSEFNGTRFGAMVWSRDSVDRKEGEEMNKISSSASSCDIMIKNSHK